MKTMMKFKVLAGQHHSGGKLFRAGDVVESTARLDLLFKGKFEMVTVKVPEVVEAAPEPQPSPAVESPKQSPAAEQVQEPEAQQPATAQAEEQPKAVKPPKLMRRRLSSK